MVGPIIGLIVIGLIAGAVARLLIPDRQDIGIIMTIVLGIIGSMIGAVIVLLVTTGTQPSRAPFYSTMRTLHFRERILSDLRKRLPPTTCSRSTARAHASGRDVWAVVGGFGCGRAGVRQSWVGRTMTLPASVPAAARAWTVGRSGSATRSATSTVSSPWSTRAASSASCAASLRT